LAGKKPSGSATLLFAVPKAARADANNQLILYDTMIQGLKASGMKNNGTKEHKAFFFC
jgi:hypothetical protein